MKTTYLLLLPLLLLFGCNTLEDDYISKYCPGSCTVIKGQVTQANNAPAAGISLMLIWQDGYLPGSVTTRKKAAVTTDENGNYELRFLLRDDELSNGRIRILSDVPLEPCDGCPADSEGNSTYINSELKRDTTLNIDFTIAP